VSGVRFPFIMITEQKAERMAEQDTQGVLALAEREEADEIRTFDADPLSFKFAAPYASKN
jgi:hypothetical protein